VLVGGFGVGIFDDVVNGLLVHLQLVDDTLHPRTLLA
jgi:hypothetical protein